MRHIGREASHLLERLLQPGEHAIEHGRQLPHLIVWMMNRQSLPQAIGGNQLCPLGHAFDRCERLACQPVRTETGHQHRERQADGQHHQQIAQLLMHRRFRPRHLDDDGNAFDT